MSVENLKAWFLRYPGSERKIDRICGNCGRIKELCFHSYTDLCQKCATNTKEFRENARKNMIKRNTDPEVQKHLSEIAREYWSHQENRDDQSKRLKKLWSNQELHDNMSKIKLQYHKDNPNAGKEQGKLSKQFYIDHPGAREKARKEKIQYYKDHPKLVDYISRCSTDQFSTQTARNEQSQRLIKYNSDHPEIGIEKSENPEFAKRISAGRQGILYEDWTGFSQQILYCHLFNLPLKKAIRLYFDNKCFMDNEIEKNGDALSVHHVNYDKRCGCDATQFCIFVPVKRSWNTIFNGNKEHNRWYWYTFLMIKIFTEHPNYFTYHIPVWGMNELEYNYNYVFEKFRRK